MAKAIVYYYKTKTGENPLSDFLDSLTEQQQTKILRVISYIKEYGLINVLPHLKKLSGTPFWEIRILGKDNLRVFYVCPYQSTVLLLHGFIKKKQKTPQRELEITTQRYNDWLLRNKRS